MKKDIFEERLKRIEARTRGGAKVELLAGVGEMEDARQAATPRKQASLAMILLGVVIGLACFQILLKMVGLTALLTLPPDVLWGIGQSEPVVGASALVLALCAVFFLTSVLRGRTAAGMMSFTGAALGAVLGSAYMTMI